MSDSSAALAARLEAARVRAQVARHRHLVIIEGEGERSRLAQALPASPTTPWIDADDAPHHLRPDRARSLLGRSLEGAVIDAHDGLDADAFGIVSGALGAGALLILLTPPLTAWANGPSRFLARLARRLPDDPDLVRWPGAQRFAAPEPLARPDEPEAIADSACVSADQAHAVAALARVIGGRARRPLVLVADRGRGKSAALGIAAARAVLAGWGPILVTAPRRSATDALWEQAHALLREAGHDPDSAQLRFVAADELARSDVRPRAVLVDEAAGLPAPLLTRLLHRHGRIAFATTVHGYEGTGRSFDVRFRATLARDAPEHRTLRLSTPIRHAPDDPLERLSFDALLLDAEPADTVPAGAGVEIVRVDRDRLIENEPLLRQLFGLLVLAHYRTRPRDLQRLLDDPRVHLHVAQRDDVVLGVVQSIDEGGLDAPLAEAIADGTRRPPGHLGAEVIAGQLGVAAGARLRSRRVMRIVVHPRVRRQGIGAALVEAVAAQASADGAALLTSSFGATPALLAFWRDRDAAVVRCGLRRDAASGEHAVLVARALAADGTRLIDRLRGRLGREFVSQCREALATLEATLLPALLANLPTPEAAACDAADRAAAQRWIRGLCPLEEVPGAVLRTALRLQQDRPPKQSAWPLLLARVLQARPWAEIVELGASSGRQAAEGALRATLAEALAESGQDHP